MSKRRHPIRSMTGYARLQRDTALGQFSVELRGVNNRFLDLNVVLPRELTELENAARQLLRGGIARGKVDARVRFVPNPGAQGSVRINEELAAKYLAALGRLGELGAAGGVTIETLAGLPGVVESTATEFDEKETWASLSAALEGALGLFNAEREREGEAILAQLGELADALEGRLAEIEGGREAIVARLRERLFERIAELMGEMRDALDPGRLEQEAAMLADKAEIAEELVRLRAHLVRYRQLLREGAPEGIGKNMDFLLQEFGREINTIGSKTRDAGQTATMLEMKSTAEKMREQIQNVE